MPRPVLGNYDGAVVSGFFVFGTRIVQLVSATVTVNVLKTLLYVGSSSLSSYSSRTPHDSKHLHGWRGREHRHWSHPQETPSSLLARDWAR